MNEQKLKLSAVVASVLFCGACTVDQAINVFWTVGMICGAIGFVIFPFRKKIASHAKKIKDALIGKKASFLLIALPAFLLFENQALAQDISFQPAVDTFSKVLKQFSKITSGACGFYGLTRVGWLLVNEDRSAGTAFVLSIIGVVVCIIAVGLLK